MKVWDLPTRIYHWLQAILFIGLIGTGFKGEGPHLYFGLALFTLIIWRLCWGVVGSETSRFKQFIRSPKVVLNYLRGKHKTKAGHNPAGGWMVMLMISALLIQCLTGLMLADLFSDFPLISLLLTDPVLDIVAIIHGVCALLLLLLVAMHLLAIVFYKIRSTPLVSAMFSGIQKGLNTENIAISSNSRALAVFVFAVCITVTIVLISA